MAYYIYRDSQGYWRWRLRAANQKIIADSGEGYFNKADCYHGIQLVKQSGLAPIIKV